MVSKRFMMTCATILNACSKTMPAMICTLVLSGCAFSSGMRVGELPPSGMLTAANGLNIQVQALTVDTLPSATLAPLSSDVRSLFSQPIAPTYVLAQGDVLGITLWAHPEITPPLVSNGPSAGFVIDQMGDISFPLIGRVHAQGQHLNQFTDNLRQRLAVYLKQPDAQVKILAYNGRKIFVDGDVRISGQYSMTDQPQTLYGAMTNAGGALPTADLNNITLARHGKIYHLGLLNLQQNGYSPSQLYLQEGDSLHVYSKETRKVYLMGEAGDPNAFSLPEEGMSLASILGEGRGLNPNSASAARVYVIRDNAGLTQIYHMDLSSIANLALAARFKLHANDVVYIDATGLARWSRVINLLLPSASALSTARLIQQGN